MNKRPSPPLVVGFLSPITCKATYCRTFLQDDSPGLSLKQFSFIQICRCWCLSYGCCRWCDGYPWWRHPNWKGQGAQWIHHGIRFFWLHGDKLREMTCRNAMVVRRYCRFPSCQLPEFEMKVEEKNTMQVLLRNKLRLSLSYFHPRPWPCPGALFDMFSQFQGTHGLGWQQLKYHRA